MVLKVRAWQSIFGLFHAGRYLKRGQQEGLTRSAHIQTGISSFLRISVFLAFSCSQCAQKAATEFLGAKSVNEQIGTPSCLSFFQTRYSQSRLGVAVICLWFFFRKSQGLVAGHVVFHFVLDLKQRRQPLVAAFKINQEVSPETKRKTKKRKKLFPLGFRSNQPRTLRQKTHTHLFPDVCAYRTSAQLCSKG